MAGFEILAGIEIRRIRGIWYLYERSWRYDPEAKPSRKVSGRRLGKAAPEAWFRMGHGGRGFRRR